MNVPIKKSFNINADVAQRIDDVIQNNPGLSFTFIMNQALANWLEKPTIQLMTKTRGQVNDGDVERFLSENSELMDDLSK